jgi:hypothetical protein
MSTSALAKLAKPNGRVDWRPSLRWIGLPAQPASRAMATRAAQSLRDRQVFDMIGDSISDPARPPPALGCPHFFDLQTMTYNKKKISKNFICK